MEILWSKDWSQGLKNTVVENTASINLGNLAIKLVLVAVCKSNIIK